MMLIDSNIIIYASQRKHGWLRKFIAEHSHKLPIKLPIVKDISTAPYIDSDNLWKTK